MGQIHVAYSYGLLHPSVYKVLVNIQLY